MNFHLCDWSYLNFSFSSCFVKFKISCQISESSCYWPDSRNRCSHCTSTHFIVFLFFGLRSHSFWNFWSLIYLWLSLCFPRFNYRFIIVYLDTELYHFHSFKHFGFCIENFKFNVGSIIIDFDSCFQIECWIDFMAFKSFN
jgi:hypothetical protein